MGGADADLFAQKRTNFCGGLVDGLRAVVEIVDLAAPVQLPAHGVGQQAPVVLDHIGLDGLAVDGGLLQRGHIPQAGEGHVQGPGDGRGGEGQDIDLTGHFFELLLVANPEALLFIHDEQAQVVELNVLPQKLVGADEQVHGPLFRPP